MGRGDTKVSDIESVRTKERKSKKEERKSERAYYEREYAKKLCFLWLQMNIIFIGDVIHYREIVFQIFFWKTAYRK